MVPQALITTLENAVYYIFRQCNYNLKVYDALKIHRLKDNPEEETVVIRFLPTEYVWKPSDSAAPYLADTGDGDAIDAYIAQIKDEITSEQYLDRGTSRDGARVYYGDEEETADFLLDAYKTVYHACLSVENHVHTVKQPHAGISSDKVFLI